MYKQFNANPQQNRVDDCVIRAISTALGKSWEETYIELCLYGLKMYDMPSANHIWGAYLVDQGFTRHIIPDSCPLCHTVKQFAEEHPSGTYIIALSGHVVSCIDGCYLDSWDSGDEVAIYYWMKEEE